MEFKMKGARLAALLVPALALAAPAFAQVRPTTLSDSQEPGSVIAFPKFIQGTVVLPEGGTAPITELEIGVVCKETDFDVNATVYEKIVLVPGGSSAGVSTKSVPAANCPNGGGYLIGWVISPTNDQPIKFDGLIGDAHLRPGAPAGSAFAASPFALADY